MKLQESQLYYESANDAIVQYIAISDIDTSLLYDTDFPNVCEHEDIDTSLLYDTDFPIVCEHEDIDNSLLYDTDFPTVCEHEDIDNSLLYDTDFPIVCEHEDIPYQRYVYDQDALDDQILYGQVMYADVPNQQIVHVQQGAQHENPQLVQEVQLVEQVIDNDALDDNDNDALDDDDDNDALDDDDDNDALDDDDDNDALDDDDDNQMGAALIAAFQNVVLIVDDSGCSESDDDDDDDDSFVSFHSDVDLDYDSDFWPESDTDSGVHPL